MQIRVVTDQPWEVASDLLVVPVVGEPDFSGDLDVLDRRTGGELRAIAAFGELRGRRYPKALAASGDLPARRVLMVATGDALALDRETARRMGATAIRRLIDREATTMAVWLSPLAAHLDGGMPLAAELVTRGVVEGSFDPKTIYREDSDEAPPRLDELVLIAPGADRRRSRVRPSAARSSGTAPTSPGGWPTGLRTTSRPRSWRTRRGPSPRRTACGSTSSTRSAPPRWAWACSSRSARGATTRPG